MKSSASSRPVKPRAKSVKPTKAGSLPTKQVAELRRLAAKPERNISTKEIPEILDWSQAQIGKFYRPIKKSVTMRVDADVLAWFKAQHGPYQTLMNQALRAFLVQSEKRSARM